MTFASIQSPARFTFKLAALAAAVAGSLLLALPAAAQSASSTPLGPYVGATLGKPDWNADAFGASGESSRAAYKLYGGWRMHPNLAVEASAFNLGRLKGPLGDARADGYAIDAVGMLPWSNTLTGLARVGVGQVKTRFGGASDRNTAPKVGLGLQYQLNTTTAVRGEWERYRLDAFNGKSNTDVFSLGAQVSF